MNFTQKGDCMCVLRGRKEWGARVNSFFECHVFIHIRAYGLSSNRSVAPQNHQNISKAKYFGNSREQFRVLFILKKSILNFENPLFITDLVF